MPMVSMILVSDLEASCSSSSSRRVISRSSRKLKSRCGCQSGWSLAVDYCHYSYWCGIQGRSDRPTEPNWLGETQAPSTSKAAPSMSFTFVALKRR